MASKGKAATPKQKADDKVEDLVACPVCGAYGEAGAAACDRTDCPRDSANT